MCGIAACLSLKNTNIAEKIVQMLKGLEYRGYDSVGMALISNNEIDLRKEKGKIKGVSKRLNFKKMKGSIGIGHTRWATHGRVNKRNAHPHIDCTNSFAVVHNGIIKNYAKLREKLKKNDHTLKSKTDTEVIPHLIESHYKEKKDVFKAFKATLEELDGAFATAMVSKKEENKIYFARKFSPLLIGIADDSLFLASDAPAFLQWTNKAIYLKEGDYGYISNKRIKIENLQSGEVDRKTEELPWNPKMAKKGGYSHFMLKEIHEQPQGVRRTLQRVNGEIGDFIDFASNAENIYITGAGTSFYASLHGEYSLSNYGFNAKAIIASEFVDRKINCIDEDTVVIGVSQSGETADTLDALRKSKKSGARIASITNTVGSTITRISDIDLIIGAGPEIGVAATKTFTSQIATLCSITLDWAERRGYQIEEIKERLSTTPNVMNDLIHSTKEKAKEFAQWIAGKKSCYFIGKGMGLPTTLEGALKLKEVAYIHAEGYSAGESKHGPISLVEKGFPLIGMLLQGQDEVRGNLTELKSRGGDILLLTEENERISDYHIRIPHGYSNILAPLVYVIPLQLLSYYTAVRKGYNPDKPRNLAKCVTVK